MRWKSGAALALVTALSGSFAHLSLRAASAGPAAGTGALAVATCLLALLLWPLAARTTGVLALAALLAAAQVGSHALAVLLAGQWAPSHPSALVCCPSAQQVRPGLLGQLTAQAGVLLLAVQLAACLLLALLLRSGRRTCDDLAEALAAVRSLLVLGRDRLVLRLRTALRLVADLAPPAPWTPRSAEAVLRLGPGRDVGAAVSWRGPPARTCSFAARHLPTSLRGLPGALAS